MKTYDTPGAAYLAGAKDIVQVVPHTTARAAYRRYLKTRHGITFYRGRTRTEYDGDVFEIVDRATGQPLFAAIPQEI